MRIRVIEDNATIRNITMRQLEPLTSNGWFKLDALEVPKEIPAEVLATELAMPSRKPSFSVLVLDLALGNRTDDGLIMMDYLRHCFDGAVVIHSSQYGDQGIRERAKKLGIRFGTNKNSPELPELVKAASEVAFMRSATLGDGLMYERCPLPDYNPSGLVQFDELMLKLRRLGRKFDGSSDSVDWTLLEEVQTGITDHVNRAKEQGYARFYQDNPYKTRQGPFWDFFEDFVINTIPVQLDLKRSFERHIAKSEPFITF